MYERRGVRVALLIAIALSGSGLVIVVGMTQTWTSSPVLGTTVLTAALVGALTLYGREKYVRPTYPTGRMILPEEVEPIEDYIRRIVRNCEQVDADQLRCFAQMIVNPKGNISRIVERIEPLKRVLRQKVSLNVFIPLSSENTDDYFLFPVMTIPKGEMQDDFRVSLDDGESPPILSYSEYLSFIILALRVFMVRANVRTATVALDGKQHSVDDIVTDAVSLVCKRGPVGDVDIDSADRAVANLRQLASSAEIPQFIELVARLVSALSTNYPIVAAVPRPAAGRNRRVVRYERYLIPTLQTVKSRPLRTVTERLGMLVGSRPIELLLNLDLAARCHSYHLFVQGPEGTYVGAQQIANQDDFLARLDRRKYPYLRLRRRLGQSYAHAYFRGVPKIADPAVSLGYRVRFYETPPGSIARSSIAAIGMLALAYIAARYVSVVNDVPGVYPTLVLMLPAVFSAWVTFKGSSNRLLGGTLTARVSSGLTIFSSIWSVVLLTGQASHLWRVSSGSFSILGIDDIGWLILTGICLLNAIWSTYEWIGHTVHFYRLAMRDIGGPELNLRTIPQARS